MKTETRNKYITSVMENKPGLYTKKELENMTDEKLSLIYNNIRLNKAREKNGSVSPLLKEAISECKKEFQDKNFGEFNKERDVNFIIKKMRELKGISTPFNLNLSQIKIKY